MAWGKPIKQSPLALFQRAKFQSLSPDQLGRLLALAQALEPAYRDDPDVLSKHLNARATGMLRDAKKARRREERRLRQNLPGMLAELGLVAPFESEAVYQDRRHGPHAGADGVDENDREVTLIEAAIGSVPDEAPIAFGDPGFTDQWQDDLRPPDEDQLDNLQAHPRWFQRSIRGPRDIGRRVDVSRAVNATGMKFPATTKAYVKVAVRGYEWAELKRGEALRKEAARKVTPRLRRQLRDYAPGDPGAVWVTRLQDAGAGPRPVPVLLSPPSISPWKGRRPRREPWWAYYPGGNVYSESGPRPTRHLASDPVLPVPPPWRRAR